MILTLQTGSQYHTEMEQLSTIPLCHCGQLRLNACRTEEQSLYIRTPQNHSNSICMRNDKRLHISHTLREHGCLGEENTPEANHE